LCQMLSSCPTGVYGGNCFSEAALNYIRPDESPGFFLLRTILYGVTTKILFCLCLTWCSTLLARSINADRWDLTSESESSVPF
jgi:hypothetical protein